MSKNRIVALGDFDGVHRGHAEILARLTEWAAALDAEPMVLSFTDNTKGKKMITDPAARQWLLAEQGIGRPICLTFGEWREVSAEKFVDYLKEEWQVVGLICGQDLHFGKDRLGNEFTLISRGIAVKRVNDLRCNERRISSSAIRSYLEQGALAEAEEMLGHPFFLMGEVCHGKGLAHRHGLPTVNLPLSAQQVLPPFGVYAAYACIDGERYPAVANIGVRPTVEKNAAPNLEAHILQEVGDLYGKTVRVELKSYLRAERKFENEEQLFLQIKEDGEMSKARLELLK